MTKDEIIDYVLNSPENTNPNILKGMLEELDNGGSASDLIFTKELILDEDIEEWEGSDNEHWSHIRLSELPNILAYDYVLIEIFGLELLSTVGVIKGEEFILIYFDDDDFPLFI